MDDDSEALNNIIAAYIRNYLENSEEDFWAWDEINDMARAEPQKAYYVVLELLKAAPSKRVISYIAAGPLEDLLIDHGLSVIDKVKHEAVHNKRLRYALAVIYLDRAQAKVRAEVERIITKYNLRDRDQREKWEISGDP